MKKDKWTSALVAEIERSQKLPFAYGSHDCLQFPARCVYSMTGIDHAAAFGEYSDPAALLAAHGGVEGILTGLLGPKCHSSMASDGDVVTAEIGGVVSAGICMSGKFLFARQPSGLASLPRRMITGCWKP